MALPLDDNLMTTCDYCKASLVSPMLEVRGMNTYCMDGRCKEDRNELEMEAREELAKMDDWYENEWEVELIPTRSLPAGVIMDGMVGVEDDYGMHECDRKFLGTEQQCDGCGETFVTTRQDLGFDAGFVVLILCFTCRKPSFDVHLPFYRTMDTESF